MLIYLDYITCKKKKKKQFKKNKKYKYKIMENLLEEILKLIQIVDEYHF